MTPLLADLQGDSAQRFAILWFASVYDKRFVALTSRFAPRQVHLARA